MLISLLKAILLVGHATLNLTSKLLVFIAFFVSFVFFNVGYYAIVFRYAIYPCFQQVFKSLSEDDTDAF